MNYRYIVIEGMPAAGKSALADKLAFFFNGAFIGDDPGSNPFLRQFLRNPQQQGLAAQLYFLTARAELLNKIRRHEAKNTAVIITDFLADKDKIYVPLTLTTAEQNLYWLIRNKLPLQALKPDLIILLNPAPEQIQAHRQRQIPNDKELSSTAAAKIHEEYQRFFYSYDAAPLLIINTQGFDFINDDDYFKLLLKTLNNLNGKTNYLNINEKI